MKMFHLVYSDSYSTSENYIPCIQIYPTLIACFGIYFIAKFINYDIQCIFFYLVIDWLCYLSERWDNRDSKGIIWNKKDNFFFAQNLHFFWWLQVYRRTGSRDLVLNRRQIIFTDWFIRKFIDLFTSDRRIAVNPEKCRTSGREGPSTYVYTSFMLTSGFYYLLINDFYGCVVQLYFYYQYLFWQVKSSWPVTIHLSVLFVDNLYRVDQSSQ